MKRRIVPLLCALALAVGVFLPVLAASADEPTVYQTAINENLLTLSGDSMPAVIGGVCYVPYTVFDRDVTGVNLGVSYGQWKTETEHTLTIYSLSGLLTFDINAGTCVDGGGSSKGMRAVLRNGKVYVPVGGVCSFFGLQVSYTETEYGTLVRITNDRAVLSTERYVDAASYLMRQRYNAYLRSLPSASPSASPSVSVSAAPSEPAQTSAPPDEDKRNVRVYLAVQCTDGEGLDAVLDTLEENGVQALFCFRPADLADHGEQIRRMAGSGHMVGLLAPEELKGEELLAALAEGERLLARIARLRSHIVMQEGRWQQLPELTQSEQWVCWKPNVYGLSAGHSSAGLTGVLLEEIGAKRRQAMVQLDDSAVSARALSRLLPQLRQTHYSLRLPVETEL